MIEEIHALKTIVTEMSDQMMIAAMSDPLILTANESLRIEIVMEEPPLSETYPKTQMHGASNPFRKSRVIDVAKQLIASAINPIGVLPGLAAPVTLSPQRTKVPIN